MARREDRMSVRVEEPREEKSYLDLKLLGTVLTYAIVVMVALGLVFLGGVVIWVMRHILGV